MLGLDSTSSPFATRSWLRSGCASWSGRDRG